MPDIKAFLNELKDTVVDFSELNVRTFEGKIEAVISADDAGPGDNLENIERILKQAVAQGEIQLMASTTHKVDKDVDQFFDSDISPELKKEHQDTVNASKAARAALLKSLLDTI